MKMYAIEEYVDAMKERESAFSSSGNRTASLSLIREILGNVNTKDKDVLVMFSQEFAFCINDAKSVTVVVEKKTGPAQYFSDIFNYNYVTFEEIQDMKFDVVIGNPPYQKADNAGRKYKLWFDFSLKAIESGTKEIAFVTPNAAFKDVDSNGQAIRNAMKKSGYGLMEFRDHGFDEFNVGVETCHWIISKESDVDVETAVFSKIDPIAQSICDKVTAYPNKLPLQMFNPHVTRNDTGAGSNTILFSGNKEVTTDKPVESYGLKVVFPFSSSYHSSFISDKPTGMLNRCLQIQSEEEGQKVLEYAMSPLFVLVANNYRKTSGFTPFVKKSMIPDLRKIDTKNLYDIFGLTQEEIDYVERNSK